MTSEISCSELEMPNRLSKKKRSPSDCFGPKCKLIIQPIIVIPTELLRAKSNLSKSDPSYLIFYCTFRFTLFYIATSSIFYRE